MGFAFLEKDRRATTPRKAICKLRHKAGLTQAVATKDLARKIYAANPDGVVRYSFKASLVAWSAKGRRFSFISTVWRVRKRAQGVAHGLLLFGKISSAIVNICFAAAPDLCRAESSR
jgi:hypothetical protein